MRKSTTQNHTKTKSLTSSYATMVYGRGCNPHRSTTTFTNLEIDVIMTSLMTS